MNKIAYHLNKKKQPAQTEGKFLYYYPCKKRDMPNVHVDGQSFIVTEVSEQEWETLIELDRLEYNNTHKYQRHTCKFSDVDDEDALSPKAQEKRISEELTFTDTLAEEMNREELLNNLTEKEKIVVRLSDEGITQSAIAEKLGVTQGYVATTLKKANEKMNAYDIEKATPDEIVWKHWRMFAKTGEMPDYLDVQLEFVIRAIFKDIMPFTHWFYSVGELGAT